jgi:hypothetical protein
MAWWPLLTGILFFCCMGEEYTDGIKAAENKVRLVDRINRKK